MINKVIILIIFIFIFSTSYSQSFPPTDKDTTFTENVEKLNNMFRNLIKKENRKLSKKEDLNFVHIFVLKYTKDSISKNEILDYNFFVDHLEFIYENVSKRDKYLRIFYTYVIDSENDLRAGGSYLGGFKIYIYDKEKMSPTYMKRRMNLPNLLLNNEMDLIFSLSRDNIIKLGIYFAIKDNQLYGIEETKDGIVIYDTNELVANHWEKFFEDN